MTEQEAKTLAAELEGNRYWEVVQVGPVSHNSYDGEETCTFVVRHKMARWMTQWVTGVYDATSVRRGLIDDGPKYAQPEYRERPRLP